MREQTNRIIRTTNILAVVVSVIAATLLPLVYFSLRYQAESAVLESEAETFSSIISGTISRNPDFWRYEKDRLEELLSRNNSKEYKGLHRIIDLNGNLIASNPVAVEAPVIMRSHDLFDAGNVVARIEVIRSARPIVLNTLLLSAPGFMIGLAGFVFLRTVPLRALSSAIKSLYESEEKFRAITTTAVDGIIVMDNKGCIVYWNPAAERMFGYSQQDALGRELHMLLAPEKYHGQYKKGFEAFRSTGQGVAVDRTFEFTAIRKDGTEFPMEVSTSAIRIKGEWHAVGLVHDITERKNAEKDLAEMYEAKRNEAEISGSLLQLVETLNTSLEEKELVRNILNIAPQYLQFGRMALFFYDDAVEGFTFAGSYGLDADKETILSARVFKAGDMPAIDMALRGETVLMEDPRKGKLLREDLIDMFDIKSAVMAPVSFNGNVRGILCGDYTTVKSIEPKDLALMKGLADGIGIAFQNARLYKDLQQLLINTISSLISIIDAKSPWTKGHSERVTGYAVEIAREMGLKEKDLNHIRLCGILHDIGKIGTFDGLLDKPGKLTDEEYEIIKKHPEKGAEIIAPIKQLNEIIPGVLHHHERYDGNGYPLGLRGSDIPLCASILAVADSFDSMTADRPYRKAPGKEFAISELKRCSGTQFSPEVVEVFLKVLVKPDEKAE
ncbi:MAG: PAS domain S-box protein [Nitrospiraceae bacterium]|nr:MAG: PAS domain S-box protein [Nitrospiraceae bacterium]